ncbi:ribosome biogenesis protein SLX9 homolog [Sorex fumeus]|uniref:ribosome biogenesis protein SLX9 homolog n=1 Tax=Sorex fumeus TaxID=62283 RepID=UPI0024ACF0B6|nr:ribosome biogenesis protein SLX9 homolog [Sorex fumeus]
MGKVRALRSRVHRAAVRPAGEAAGGPARPEDLTACARAPPAPPLSQASGGAGVFSGTRIEPGVLVQTLEPDTRSVASAGPGVEHKAILPKKEKLRLRRERWLQKIEAIKQTAREQQAARRRRAAVVVGDLQPLRDALPDLLQLEAVARAPRSRSRPSSRPQATELSRMSTTQRQQLLEEERTRFRELLASPTYRACPLLAIREQLHSQAL